MKRSVFFKFKDNKGELMAELLVDKIVALESTLPKKQRQLCMYILENQARIGMMTVAELAANAGVGTTTVLRLSEMLGFSSYTDFKRTFMEERITRENRSYNQLIHSFSGKRASSSSSLAAICGETEKNFSNLLSPENEQAFEAAIRAMLAAGRINVLGMRSSAAMAIYLANSLSTFMPNVRHLAFEQEYLLDRVFSFSADEVLFVVSVWPCTRRTVEVAEVAHKRGVPVILLTNTRVNPIAKFADVVLDTNSINQSSTPVLLMTLLTALVQELGSRSVPRSTEALEALEKQLAENHLIQWERGL